ncbi:hypothetical protein [Roseomonas marmotae]|uniref:Uncharacterized protein n=1 Tax=Roseomonas marmotae TaxID=2768161 RepID=A0ABS3KGP2_9PROT|nr:hypothetical protein [Roseomonas marmotae]MBO1076142.1 hypothetical protein [Roseomonas marmotae]QTI81275.1 hypothetical protein IAI58_18125 [Roseomonas marmotae]
MGTTWDECEEDGETILAPRRRQQQRRRALAPELRGEFDRRLLCGEDILNLSRAFDIEPWYAQRRARRVLSRASRDREVSPFLAPLSEMEEDMTPLQYACGLLGLRVRPLRNGYYILDGRQAGPREVARAANRLLRERGLQEIPYPGLTPLYK